MTWWIDEPFLAGSPNPSQDEVDEFIRKGGTVIISLLNEPDEAPAYRIDGLVARGCSRYNFPVPDFHAPTLDQVQVFVRLLAQFPSSAKVLVHCQGGSGRTGTFAAAYWISKRLSCSEAIARVRAVRKHAIETAEQERLLEQLAAALAPRDSG